MKYTKIPETAFQNIQLNAGILVDSFIPATGEIGRLLGATTGGIQFADAPEFSDYGEDIDNCPKGTKELKKMTSHAVTMSGTFVTIDAATVALLAGAADIDEGDETHIVPRNDLVDADFKDVWWVGDYSDQNTGENAGFVAVHLMNALNTGGFQIQSTDRAKGQFAFSFEGHYSMNAQDTVPYEVYVREGGEQTLGSVLLNTHAATVEAEGTLTLTATTVPAGETVTWSSSDSTVASVSGGVVTAGSSAGSAIITASITVDGVTYTDTCTIVVEE